MKAIAITALVLVSGTSFAQVSASERSAPERSQGVTELNHTSSAATGDERLQCRYVQAQSNSRLARVRVCHTRAEWREIATEFND